ncbi:hypothetical protein D1007_02189 [Hordeum vulgare]|nr:hypothetical protein D1007_02189 [Hordeum vulgare]
MARVAESATTADLQLESLELDLKSLRQERDEDRKEFHQFQATVNKNLITMQNFFDKIQDNFTRLLLDPDPGRSKQLVAETPPSITMPEKATVGGIGTSVLRDQAGRELNMDGTLKQPNRHPNFGINKAEGMGQNAMAVHAVQGEELQEIEGYDNNYRRRVMKLGGVTATALVDSGSNATFVYPEMASKMSIARVANTKGSTFCDSFRILKWTGHDLILGVDWLKKYSLVQMDFIKMELKIAGTQGQVITFVDETVPLEKITESKDKTSRFMEQAICGFFLFPIC